MSIFTRLFKNPNTECPRCLGKGNVDWNDINRLNKQLKWLPGKCALCKGTGKVHQEKISKSLTENTYLTINLQESERQKIVNSDEEALQRSKIYDEYLDNLIKEIERLHFVEKKTAEEIATALFLNHTSGLIKIKLGKRELKDYVQKVIELKKTELK